MTDANMTEAEVAARRFYEVLAASDANRVEQVLDPGWEQIPLGEHSSPGTTGYRELIEFLGGAFTNITITVDEVIVDSFRVAIRTTTRATHTGAEIMGVTATGTAIEFRASDFHHVQDGRIARTWHLEDYQSLMQQLGI